MQTFNLHLEEWSMDNNMSKIWVGMSTTNNRLFTSIQNSKSLTETGTLNAGTSELIPKKTV